MSDFDESKVNRGQPANEGQFAEKDHSAPEGALPKPYVPGTLGGYSIKTYRAHRAGSEGGGFTAGIYRGGERVLNVSNAGNGGSNLYRSVSGAGPNEQAAFDAAARRIMGDDGDGYFEPDQAVELILTVGRIQRFADAAGMPYAEFAGATLEDPSWDDVREILLHPEAY